MAVFGLGDAVGYSEYFCDAMEEIYSTFKAAGAKLVGHWPADGYEHEGSKVSLPYLSAHVAMSTIVNTFAIIAAAIGLCCTSAFGIAFQQNSSACIHAAFLRCTSRTLS